MANTSYCYTTSSDYIATVGDAMQTFQLKDGGLGIYKLTSSFRGESVYVNAAINRTNSDFNENNLLIHGDLA